MTVDYIKKVIAELEKTERTDRRDFIIFILKREIPKSVFRTYVTNSKSFYKCPVCGRLVGNHKNIKCNECYCKHCGQKISYEGE